MGQHLFFDTDSSKGLRGLYERILQPADIHFDGYRPWDIQVNDERLFRRVLTGGSLAFGEAYMDGWWNSKAMDQLFTRLLRLQLDRKVNHLSPMISGVSWARHHWFNLQSIKRAFHVGEQHYDIGNDLFEKMLDPTMSYSCGYWAHSNTLEQAQLAKLHLICRKLELEPGMKLLEIGCGWGGLAEVAARDYGVEVVGVTISSEQKWLAEKRLAGLPVEIRLQDYRELQGQFDRVVSVGMFEHVGVKNYQAYFSKAAELLREDGLFLLHSIGTARAAPHTDPWIDKYIFPNGYIPALTQILPQMEPHFVVEDLHNFGPDYDRTLMAWWENFERGWPELKMRYDDRFYRMWKYYLMSCAGFFRARQGQLWQFVLSRHHGRKEYLSLR